MICIPVMISKSYYVWCYFVLEFSRRTWECIQIHQRNWSLGVVTHYSIKMQEYRCLWGISLVVSLPFPMYRTLKEHGDRSSFKNLVEFGGNPLVTNIVASFSLFGIGLFRMFISFCFNIYVFRNTCPSLKRQEEEWIGGSWEEWLRRVRKKCNQAWKIIN